MKLNQFAIAIAFAIFSLTIESATTCCCSSSSTNKTIIMEIYFDQFEIRCFGWTSIVMTLMRTYPFLESIFSHVWSKEKWSRNSKLHIICIFRNPIVKSKITGSLKGRKILTDSLLRLLLFLMLSSPLFLLLSYFFEFVSSHTIQIVKSIQLEVKRCWCQNGNSLGIVIFFVTLSEWKLIWSKYFKILASKLESNPSIRWWCTSVMQNDYFCAEYIKYCTLVTMMVQLQNHFIVEES